MSTMPRRAASPARSGQLHLRQRHIAVGGQLAGQRLHLGHHRRRRSGAADRCGADHARPSRPCWQNRRRHLRTVSSVTPRVRPIAAFGRAVGGGQHDPGAQHVAMLTAGSASPGQQQPPLPIAQNDLIGTQHRHRPFVARHRPVPATTRRSSRFEHHGRRAHASGVDQDLACDTG